MALSLTFLAVVLVCLTFLHLCGFLITQEVHIGSHSLWSLVDWLYIDLCFVLNRNCSLLHAKVLAFIVHPNGKQFCYRKIISCQSSVCLNHSGAQSYQVPFL